MMTEHFRDDPFLRTIANLTTYEPNRRRADRIRARCHVRIAKRKRAEPLSFLDANRYSRRVLETSVVVIVCAVYLGEVLRRALSLYGF